MQNKQSAKAIAFAMIVICLIGAILAALGNAPQIVGIAIGLLAANIVLFIVFK